MSCNVNGIRSAHKKGFWDWCRRQKADVICLQEVRADGDKIPEVIRNPKGYYSQFFPAERAGYSGVAILSVHRPDKIVCGLGKGFEDMDAEGRYVQMDFGDLSVASVYFPSGSASEDRQGVKMDFLGRFENWVKPWAKSKRQLLFCGDLNIAHKQIDIKNWRSNQKNSGFLPEERGWMDRLFDTHGFVDTFRVVNQEADQYTWWSNRGNAYANNVGWRIDYQVASPALADKIKSADIYKRKKFSDHAPLTIEYEL